MVVDPAPPMKTIRHRLVAVVKAVGLVVAVMWAVEIVDTYALDSSLEPNGIHPRMGDGLPGILWAPLLHGRWTHLVSNTVPFVVLGALVALRGIRPWIAVTIGIVLLGGLGTWLFARVGNHLGASSVIFGYLGFLLAIGFFERSYRAMAVAVVVGVLYGSTIWGVLPGQPGVSWEGHLFGFSAGIGMARLAANPRTNTMP